MPSSFALGPAHPNGPNVSSGGWSVPPPGSKQRSKPRFGRRPEDKIDRRGPPYGLRELVLLGVFKLVWLCLTVVVCCLEGWLSFSVSEFLRFFVWIGGWFLGSLVFCSFHTLRASGRIRFLGLEDLGLLPGKRSAWLFDSSFEAFSCCSSQ